MLLPELFALIAPYLDPPSLVSASQVSRCWFTSLTPVLWSTIADSDWILPHFSPRQLYAHGHLVHSLTWDSLQSQPHSLFLTRPPSLLPSSLEQDGDSAAGRKDKEYHDHGTALRKMLRVIPVDSASRLSMRCLVHIVGNCAHLQHLKLNFGAYNGDPESEEGRIVGGMIQVIRNLRCLQRLELVAHSVLLLPEDKKFNDDNSEQVAGGHSNQPDLGCTSTVSASRGLNVQWLLQDLPNLQSLDLRGSAFWFDMPSPRLPTASSTETSTRSATTSSATTTKPTFPIRHLSLEPAASVLTEEALMFLIEQCPRLTSLDLPGGLAWEISPAFTKHLQTSCPNLDSFSINASSASVRGHSLIPDTADQPPLDTTNGTDTPTAPSSTPPTQAQAVVGASLHVRIIPEDDRLASLIRGLTQSTEVPLRSFGARSCYFGNASLQALEELCPSLEKLDLSLNRASSSAFVSNHPAQIALATAVTTVVSQERTVLSKDRLVQYLKRAENLKELIAEGVWIDLADLLLPSPPPSEGDESQHGGHGEHGEPVMTAELAQQQQHQHWPVSAPTVEHWACATTLTRLVLGFSAFNQAHQAHLHSYPSTSSTVLYTFLSSLRSLQVLKISNTTLTDFQTPNTYLSTSSLPQPSSFHLLSALRDLREFDIETCSYSPSGLMNKGTIQWMVGQAWPKLESLQIHRLGVSQERELHGWLKEVGRDRLVVNGCCNRVLHSANGSNGGSEGGLGGSQELSVLSSLRLMNMMMSY
ncbi:hypothetical protein EMPS_07330 [Entomortierella parvispora]|uniref:F-box domain-containing protein n=1 Tax=Entomortierella parvispora TaxID=205924 RepID=A0A9P3HER0_9FUNG|nr:hypothetical protein EMPS_07330 [Entomortierella parvispora]